MGEKHEVEGPFIPRAVMEGANCRTVPGLPPLTRRSRYTQPFERWLFSRWDPDLVEGSEKPDPAIQAALLDVFGYDRVFEGGRERLKIRLHPVFKRWCVFERQLDPKRGEHNWKVVLVADCETPHDEYVPTDWRETQFLQHLHGVIGEYRPMNRQDLEILERCDKKKYGARAVEAYFHAHDEALEQERSKAMADYEQASIDYWSNWATDWANQMAGSGEHMRSVPWDAECERPESDPRKWVTVEEREGFKVRRRATPEERARRAKLYDIAKETETPFADVLAEAEAEDRARAEARKALPRRPGRSEDDLRKLLEESVAIADEKKTREEKQRALEEARRLRLPQEP